MDIRKIGLPSILLDNDMQYISHMLRVIQKIDPDASVIITLSNSTYRFLVKVPESLRKALKMEIEAAHQLFGLEVLFSPQFTDTVDFSLI